MQTNGGISTAISNVATQKCFGNIFAPLSNYVCFMYPKQCSERQFFYHLHLAVDNLHVTVDLTMMYLRNFLVAQLTILFGIVMSAAAPAEARQRRIVNILCDFCGKSFPNSWAYERHRTCTKLKGTGCYSQATHKVELLATRRGTMATAMLSRSLSQGRRGSYVLTRNKRNKYLAHIFSHIFTK
jgi:hypothetical protein